MPRSKQFSRQYVLRVIRDWVVERGFAPTIEELQRELGVGSKKTVTRYLNWLESEGDIERWPGARGIRLLRGASGGIETAAVPLVGVVSAGPMMLAEQNVEGYLRLPKRSLATSRQHFLLRVHGNSMNRAAVEGGYIEDGDLVLVKQQPIAEHGDVVVALVDDEATIKRLGVGPGYHYLQPESTARHEMIVLDHEFAIQGVVTRVIKGGSELFGTVDL